MSEQDEMPAPLDPWVRAALLAEGLDGGPSDAQRSRMAGKLDAALGLSAAALLGSSDGGGGDGDGGAGDGGGGAGGSAGAAAAGAGVAGVAGTTLGGKTAALVIGAVLAGGGIGATISELRPRALPPAERPGDRIASDGMTPDATLATPDGSSDGPNDASSDGPSDGPNDGPNGGATDDVYAPIDAAPAARRDASVSRPDAALAMTAGELAREREMIDVARSALRNGDLQLAGKSLVEHGLRFPRGVLVEEQRVLSIELLVAKGDLPGATTKANAFRRDFPRSVFRARVDEIAPP
jgi:hypothetical protein